MADAKPINVRDGSVYIDKVKVLDAVKLTMKFTPEVQTFKTLRQKGTSRRWAGHDITGEFSEYKSTRWLDDKIDEYMTKGITPVMEIQGIRDDADSDYFDNYGKGETVTVTGAVLTGDLPLMELDTGGELVQNSVSFGASNYTRS